MADLIYFNHNKKMIDTIVNGDDDNVIMIDGSDILCGAWWLGAVA